MECTHIFNIGILIITLSFVICNGSISLPLSGLLKSGRTHMLPGSTYKMGCEMSGDLSPGDILMLTRKKSLSIERHGSSSVTTEKIFVENGDLLLVNESDRYTVMDYINTDSMIKFDLEVTDAKPEDSGHFVCQVNTSSSGFQEPATPTEITVIGPIHAVTLFASPYGNISNELAKVESGGEVTLMENEDDYLFYSELEYENFLPNYHFYLQHEEDGKIYKSDVDVKSYSHTYSHVNILTNSLVSYYHVETIRLRDTRLTQYQSNRKSLYGVAFFPPLEGIPTQPNVTSHIILNILFNPKDMFCKDEIASVGDDDVTILCTVLANPRPTIEWDILSDKNVTKPNLQTKEEYHGSKLTVTFTFPTIEESHYSFFKVSAQNEYGETTTRVKLLGVVSSTSILQGSTLLLLLSFFLAVYVHEPKILS